MYMWYTLARRVWNLVLAEAARNASDGDSKEVVIHGVRHEKNQSPC